MARTGSATILSMAARYVGNLESDEDIILAGSFEGSLRTTGSVQVASTAKVRGEIHATSVVVSGQVVGPITATDHIELQPGATVTGDLLAQGIRMQDNVLFNGACRMVRLEGPRRHYLIPAAVQSFGEPPSGDALEAIQQAAESFLRDFGFEAEVRPGPAGRGDQTLRPIFRSREPLPYEHLRERLRFVERALQSVTTPGPAAAEESPGSILPGERGQEVPLQATGADGARALVEALGRLRSAALLVGPVIMTRTEEARGPRVNVRVRADSLPAEGAALPSPDPTSLLVSLQRLHTEVIRDLTAGTSRFGRRRA